LIFEILQITLFFKNLFREYTMLDIIKTFFVITIIKSFRKKEKKNQKNNFFSSFENHHRFKNLIITSKVKREDNKEVSIGKAYSNRAS
jgi:hypothetical protein